MSLVVRFCSLALAATIVLASPAAAANGAFPKAGQLVVNSLDPQHIAVRSTFGMLVSYDQGQS